MRIATNRLTNDNRPGQMTMKPPWLGAGFLTTALSLSLAPGIAFGANSKASTQGECSLVFVQAQVHGNQTINRASYRRERQPVADTLNASRREQRLSDAQMWAAIEASKVMVGAILTRFGTMATDLSETKRNLRNMETVIEQRLPKSGAAPERIVAGARRWKERCDTLLDQSKQVEGEGKLDEEARLALLDLDLDKAVGILDRLLDQSKQAVKTAALRHYCRAEGFRLQFRPPNALPRHKTAYALDPGNPEFGFVYAVLLDQQNDFAESERVYVPLLANFRQPAAHKAPTYRPEVAATRSNLAPLDDTTKRSTEGEAASKEAVDVYRALARDNPAVYQPELAITLSNLAILYLHAQRPEEGAAASTEALGIYRALARDNPAVYQPEVAMTLNNLAILYHALKRFKEAEAACVEALGIYRALARDNPAADQPELAITLNNLAILYLHAQRFKKAEAASKEAADIYRALARDNPAVYEPELAMALNNLAILYHAMKRFKEAESAFAEAVNIYRALARDNPGAFQPALAMTLNNLASVYRATERFKEAEALEMEARTMVTK